MAQPVIQYFVTTGSSSLDAGPFPVNELPAAQAYAKKIAGKENSPAEATVVKYTKQVMFTYTPVPRPDPIES